MVVSKVRIGILGAGGMGAAHAAAFAEMQDVQVVGVFARDATRAKATADICGSRTFDDARALIGDVDAVDVCVPSEIHHTFVLPALQQGKHVFCETPLTLDLECAVQMRGAARDAKCLLQVGLLMRSIAQYEHIKTMVTSGEHGRLLSLSTYRLGSYLRAGAPDAKPHYSEPSTELMTFDFDFANWLLGRPDRLSAEAAGWIDGRPGEITAVLGYPGGQQATIAASGIMPIGFPFAAGFRALFENAVVELHNVFGDGPPDTRFIIADNSGPPRPIAVRGHNPYAAELRRFVDCILERADPGLLDVERAIEALTLSVATQRALGSARTVAIDSIRGQ